MKLCLLAWLACASLFAGISEAEGTPFTEGALNRLLAKNPRTGRPVESLSELVPLLPDELRQNFTFVYESRSLFRSSISPDFPRVILFSPDAKLVLSFTGDPSKPGYDVLETMAFNEKSSEFQLHARVLPAAQRRGEHKPSSSDCIRCHGADARPIFDSYPLWPGFYGSVQDAFPPGLASSMREKEKYLHFLATQANAGVYKGLRYIQGSSVSPFQDPKLFHPEKVEGEFQTLPYQPNTRLGMALSELNRKRIFRKLLAGADFLQKEKKYLADLLDCQPSSAAADQAPSLEAALKKENSARLERLHENPGDPSQRLYDMQELKFVHELAQIDRLARNAGVGREDWSMALEPYSLAFFDGTLSGMYKGHSYYLKEDLIHEILGHLGKVDPALRPYFRENPAYWPLGYPFGNRLDLQAASESCKLLNGRE